LVRTGTIPSLKSYRKNRLKPDPSARTSDRVAVQTRHRREDLPLVPYSDILDCGGRRRAPEKAF
jgi:hypothetical protein